MFVCDKCLNTFKSQKKLENHAKNKVPCDFVCKLCNITLGCRKSWYNHREKTHLRAPKNKVVRNTIIVNKKIQAPPISYKNITLVARRDHFRYFYGNEDNADCVICMRHTVKMSSYGHEQAHIICKQRCPDNSDVIYRVPACRSCNGYMKTSNLFDYVFKTHPDRLYPIAQKLYCLYNHTRIITNESDVSGFVDEVYNIKNDVLFMDEIADLLKQQQCDSIKTASLNKVKTILKSFSIDLLKVSGRDLSCEDRILMKKLFKDVINLFALRITNPNFDNESI